MRDSSRTIWAVERVPSEVCSVTAKMCWMLAATTLADAASRSASSEMRAIRSDSSWVTRSMSASAVPAASDSRAPSTTPCVLRSIAATASWVSVWMVRTMAAICRVASPERSARRCTSSATTLKPRPASPALAAWMAALSASTLVCSVMSEMSSVISPISCELSPRRLMRLEVSWIWSRIEFMPPMVSFTAVRPVSAARSDCRATLAVCCAWAETSLMRPAICSTDSPVSRISRSCSVDAASSSVEVCSTREVVSATRDTVLCTCETSERSSSTV